MSNTGDPAHVHMPGVQGVLALIRRWLLSTHQGSVSGKHLDYLNEHRGIVTRQHNIKRLLALIGNH